MDLLSSRPLGPDVCELALSIRYSADFYFVGLTPIHGQEQPARNNTPAPIATHRPAAINSSIVVPVGSLQAENGFLPTSGSPTILASSIKATPICVICR
jgi:hypothetical protein